LSILRVLLWLFLPLCQARYWLGSGCIFIVFCWVPENAWCCRAWRLAAIFEAVKGHTSNSLVSGFWGSIDSRGTSVLQDVQYSGQFVFATFLWLPATGEVVNFFCVAGWVVLLRIFCSRT
jgi:hypothetical protein